jgi:hypothetical protein
MLRPRRRDAGDNFAPAARAASIGGNLPLACGRRVRRGKACGRDGVRWTTVIARRDRTPGSHARIARRRKRTSVSNGSKAMGEG